MSYPSGLDIARGIVTGGRVIRQFGRNVSVGNTFVPIARGGAYRTPQVGSETALRVKSGGNANDTAAGTGAREITLIGLDANGDLIEDTIATNGTSAGPASSKQFLRLFDCFVSKSGTYATQTAQSHAATIVIENAAGGTDWATIQDTDIPRGASEIGAHSVPRNRSMYITSIHVQSDRAYQSNLVMFKRENILETEAPYSPMTLLLEIPALSGVEQLTFDPPIRIPQLSDVGFLAKSGSGRTISVEAGFSAFEVRP